MSTEEPRPRAVLLVIDKYATSVNREVAQVLTGAGRKVYCTVLQATEEDRKAAEADGVELILPTCSKEDEREPCLKWLTFDHPSRYPRLPEDVGYIVGHAGVSSKAAAAIQEQRFPQASLGLVIGTIPEDTDKYKDDEEAMGIGRKEDSIREDAEKADIVFSVGHSIYKHFQNSFRAIPEDNKPIHYLFLPEPAKIFQELTVKYVESSVKVVLSIGGVNKVERLKGYDLTAKSLVRVAETNQEKFLWRICDTSEEEFQATMSILQASIDSGKLNPTILPHCTQEDICRHMQQAHLVLMPSRAEPFGLVGLEAMAAGVPVLISDQSGLATLVEEVIPEFYHSVLEIEGDDSVDVGRWASQIGKVLRKSKVEFKRAAALKEKLLESRYWEESHQHLLQACGGAAERVKTRTRLSSDVAHARLAAGNPVPNLPVYLYLGLEHLALQQPPTGVQQPPTRVQQPPTGVQQPPTGVQQPPTGVQQPPTGVQQPPTGVQQPPAGVQQPPAGVQQPPTGVQQPPAGVQAWDTNFRKQILERILELERTVFTQEIVENPVRYKQMQEVFLPHAAFLMKLGTHCIILFLMFLHQSDLDRFYHNHYRVGEGTLSQQLSHILISDDLQNKVKGAQLIVRLQVKHEDYVRVRDRLGQGLDRTTSVDNLLALPPPSRHVDHSSLRGLDLAVIGQDDQDLVVIGPESQPCTDGTDGITMLYRQVQSAVRTAKEKSKVQLETMQGQVQIGELGVDAMRKEEKMLREEKEKSEKILLEQKAKTTQLQETNKSLEARIAEPLTAHRLRHISLTSGEVLYSKVTGVKKVSFGGMGSARGKFVHPCGVAVSKDNEVYIADCGNSRIQVFTMDGVYIREFTTTLPGETGEKLQPWNVAVDRNDNLWVVSGKHVVQYSREGTCLATIDLPHGKYLRGITVSMATEQVIVTVYGQLLVFNQDGSEVGTYGSGHMSPKPWKPRYVTVDGEGNIQVTDNNNGCVHVLDKEGNFKFKFESWGTDESQFRDPQGICVDGKGNIIVADGGNSCVKMFDSQGRFLYYILYGMTPMGVAVSPGGDVVVTDIHNDTVSVWTQG
ncbi:PREDICTED: uncharacterized protein LOC109485438 [Branchiostoma belcheri]|uniref:Uncharacterized protein LOC109485438 n=1 Tax=Branchiostoma belcheri TaxID=7741 RepID=A0A6P5AE44_BRABE|nr:PREDICTED: uncharacterized protein LOC109485438 [Branchiostoma belcheri]